VLNQDLHRDAGSGKHQGPRKTTPDDPRWRSPLPPAPGELRIVQAFLNTAPGWKTSEELTDPDALAGWLELWELIPQDTEIGKGELRRVLAVRQGLRAMVRARDGKAAPRAAEALDREAGRSRVRPRFQADGGVYYEVAAEGFEGALSRIFDAVRSAQLDGSWLLFKLCADPHCGQAFYDFSTNHGARWCREICGNRRSAASYRRRGRRLRFGL